MLDRDLELLSQALDDPGLEPVRLPWRVGGDDHLVRREDAQLVLDRTERRDRVADLAADLDAVIGEPRDRGVHAPSRVPELRVDVGGDVVDPRGEDRGHHVQLGPAGGTRPHLLSQFLAVERPIRDDEDAVALGPDRVPSLRCRLAQRPPPIRVLRGDLPDHDSRKGAGEERDADQRIDPRPERE
jgi:hypothetical protein